jgi:hypothetical protein
VDLACDARGSRISTRKRRRLQRPLPPSAMLPRKLELERLGIEVALGRLAELQEAGFGGMAGTRRADPSGGWHRVVLVLNGGAAGRSEAAQGDLATIPAFSLLLVLALALALLLRRGNIVGLLGGRRHAVRGHRGRDIASDSGEPSGGSQEASVADGGVDEQARPGR